MQGVAPVQCPPPGEPSVPAHIAAQVSKIEALGQFDDAVAGLHTTIMVDRAATPMGGCRPGVGPMRWLRARCRPLVTGRGRIVGPRRPTSGMTAARGPLLPPNCPLCPRRFPGTEGSRPIVIEST